jgi:TolB-like protein
MSLKRILYAVFFTFIGTFSFLISSSWAGQVVKEEDKIWAQEIIQKEKTLKTPEANNTLAVLYFNNQTGQSELDPLQKGIAILLITDLSKIDRLQVVERVQLQALVRELGLGASGLVDSATAPRVGRLLQARWLVGGEINKGSLENLRIKSYVAGVQTQSILGQPFSEGELQDLAQLEKNILFEIIKLLKIEPTVKEMEGLKVPCSTNFQALMALFKGVNESEQGNYEAAAEHYETALKQDKNICVARGAIEELQRLQLIGVKLIGGKKKTTDLLRSLRNETSFTDQLPEEADRREITPKDITTTNIEIHLNFP